jgi:uncharacterized membrane protein YdbT with pleckstrin-like domain
MTRRSSDDVDLQRARHLLRVRAEAAETAKLEAEADMLGERVATETENRKLRFGIAIGALVLMALQVFAANGIFAWYGVAAGWDVPSSAISAWMGTTVVEVVAVVLVIVNYLFPNEGRTYA